MTDVARAYLDEAYRSLRGHKRLAEGAMAQVSEEEFFRTPDGESNSIAIVCRHIAGNQRSRFTDFLTSDGEKPDRNRDTEFIIDKGTTRAQVLEYWERNWEMVLHTIQSLKPEDLLRTVVIRSEPHTVLQAVSRQVVHYAYHIGQIVFLAKHWRGAEWNSLSVPRGMSEEVNRKMRAAAEAKAKFPERP